MYGQVQASFHTRVIGSHGTIRGPHLMLIQGTGSPLQDRTRDVGDVRADDDDLCGCTVSQP
jgi:hypothetical protein